MAEITNIAMSGLLAYKQALEVAANNIANVNTEGYSKQKADFTTRVASQSSTSFSGAGVTLQNKERIQNEFLRHQTMRNLSDLKRHEAFYTRGVDIDTMLTQPGIDITQNLDGLFSALGDANVTPDAIATREIVLEQFEYLTAQMRTLQTELDNSQANLTSQFKTTAEEVTSLTAKIADLNGKIVGQSNPSPGLLDERDKLATELSGYLDVRIVMTNDNSMNINLPHGEALVIGGRSSTMAINATNSGASKVTLTLGSVEYDVTSFITGGSLKGELDYEENVISKVSRELGLIAIGLADSFNDQQNLGMDFDNALGENILTDFSETKYQTARASADEDNTGTSVLSINITDVSQLEASKYQLQMTSATAATLTRVSDGTEFSLVFNGTLPQAITTVDGNAATSVDGFEINIPSTSAVLTSGDIYTVEPTKGMAAFVNTLLDDPKKLALAAPIRVSASSSNSGTGTIQLSPLTTTNSTDVPDLTDQFRIEILDLSPTASPSNDFQYRIVNVTDGTSYGTPPGPPLLYGDFGTALSVKDSASDVGYDVILEGDIKVGDVFTAEYNTDGFADNRNGLIMSDYQSQLLFSDSTESFYNRYSNLVASIGSDVYQSNISMESSDILFQQSESKLMSTVGVNLDEEAANVLTLQQAYQASGQLIATSRALIDIIFSIISR